VRDKEKEEEEEEEEDDDGTRETQTYSRACPASYSILTFRRDKTMG